MSRRELGSTKNGMRRIYRIGEGSDALRFEARSSEPEVPEPYASRLKGVLEFRDLASAEHSLRRIGEIFREYSANGDRTGADFVRALARKGRRRARGLALNQRVKPEKRQEKGEIASWFQVWLETPDLFAEWLELRKGSQEFRSLFPNYPG